MSNELNTVILSKASYDSMRSTNDRAGMLLNRIMGAITIADDSDDLSVDTDTVLMTIKILYPETYNKKVSALKTIRTKNFLKNSR